MNLHTRMKTIFFAAMAVFLLVGGGCAPRRPMVQELPQQNSTSTDPSGQAEWKTITVGGIITAQIPAFCTTEGAAGSTYITCPTPDNETPTPEVVMSSDGIEINIRRWEHMDSPYWNSIISSVKVITPLTHAIQINIEA